MGEDAFRLFLARSLRLFAYGALSVVLVLYLAERGLTEARIGLLLTATLLGDTALSLWITTRADRLRPRNILPIGPPPPPLGPRGEMSPSGGRPTGRSRAPSAGPPALPPPSSPPQRPRPRA